MAVTGARRQFCVFHRQDRQSPRLVGYNRVFRGQGPSVLLPKQATRPAGCRKDGER